MLLRRPPARLFVVACALTALAYAGLIWQQMRYGIEYDEGANLNVVKNFGEGLGYVSTGLNYGWTKAFDPGASTGPTLLVPGGLLWFLSGGTLWVVRLVPIAYFLLYVGTLGWLFTRIGGRWAGLAAAASPLLLAVDKSDISTVSLMPGRYVGEIAAVSLTVLLAALIYRNRPLLAGVAGGLALQTKVNFALAVLIVLLAWMVGMWLRHEHGRGRSILRAALGLILPTAAFELFRLTQLGLNGYVVSIKDYLYWLGGQAGSQSEPMLQTIGRRVGGLVATLSPGGLIALLVLVAVLMLAAYATRLTRLVDGAGLAPDPRAFDPVVGLLGAAGATLLWWLLLPPEKLPRAGIPIILMVAPLVAAGAVLALRRLRDGTLGRSRQAVTAAVVVLALAAASLVTAQAWTAVRNDFGHRMMAEQEAAARAIIASGTPSIPNEWIWNLAQFQLLTGLPSETKPGVGAPTIKVFDSIRARSDHGADDARAFLGECAEVLLEAPSAVVCR